MKILEIFSTAQPRNRATAQPRNRATAQPRNYATVREFFCRKSASSCRRLIFRDDCRDFQTAVRNSFPSAANWKTHASHWGMAASNLKIPAAFVPLLATNFNPSAAFVNGFASNFSAFARNLGVLAANFPPPAATYNLLPQSSLYEIATTKRKMHKKIGFPLLCRLRFFAASFPPSTINH